MVDARSSISDGGSLSPKVRRAGGECFGRWRIFARRGTSVTPLPPAHNFFKTCFCNQRGSAAWREPARSPALDFRRGRQSLGSCPCWAPQPCTHHPPVFPPGSPHTHRKALAINLDARRYGTFAEIGAGQEVARWFFRVGGASGTIAKSMSALRHGGQRRHHGHPERLRFAMNRLQSMLDYEHEKNVKRLSAARGIPPRFFVFADTVAGQELS